MVVKGVLATVVDAELGRLHRKKADFDAERRFRISVDIRSRAGVAGWTGAALHSKGDGRPYPEHRDCRLL